MERWVGRVALVTGASSGIGAAIARALVREGMTVVGCARRVEHIEAIQKELEAEQVRGKLHPIRCDLTKREEIAAMFEEIKREFNTVHVCINNAGLGGNAPLIRGDPERWRRMIDVNVMALCYCTQESLRLMREAHVDDGQIIHINRLAMGSNVFYGAVKHMVTVLTEGLRRELRAEDSVKVGAEKGAKTKTRVAAISPGVVQTEMGLRGTETDPSSAKFYQDNPFIKAEDMANQVIHILKQPEYVQIHDILLRPTAQFV